MTYRNEMLTADDEWEIAQDRAGDIAQSLGMVRCDRHSHPWDLCYRYSNDFDHYTPEDLVAYEIETLKRYDDDMARKRERTGRLLF